MRYSCTLGKKSSKILLGTAYFGDTISKEDSFRIMDTYCEFGGCHIDTARLYADGEAERVIGEWLKSRRPKELFLSTKGAFPSKAAPDVPRLSEEDIRSDLEESLRALDIECIDFYWLHRDDESREAGEIIETMNRLVREGKIKRFGASNWKMSRVDEANKYASSHGLCGFEGSQIRFSPAIIAPGGDADRTLVDMDEESFIYYGKNNIPVAAYASQAKGFFSKMASKGEDGLSPKSKGRYLCEENLKRLDVLKKLSAKYECSIASAICAAMCSFDCPDVYPIIGGSNTEQIADSMRGADIVFEKEELKDLFGWQIV